MTLAEIISLHEAPWVPMKHIRITGRDVPMAAFCADTWENDRYYGTLRRFRDGFFVGNLPWAIIGISALDETAKHDWRDFQQIKNDLVGREWEAVELYPAESRLVDPSNRFYLWCAPKGCFQFGFDHRNVEDAADAYAPQRPFAKPDCAPERKSENTDPNTPNNSQANGLKSDRTRLTPTEQGDAFSKRLKEEITGSSGASADEANGLSENAATSDNAPERISERKSPTTRAEGVSR